MTGAASGELVDVRKRLLLGALALALCVGAAIVVITLRNQPAVNPAAELSSTPPVSATRTDVDEVSALLTRLPEEFQRGDRSALATASPAAEVDLTAVFPSDAEVTTETESWQQTGAVASLIITVTAGGASERHLAILLRQPDGWRLSETYPAV